MSGETNAVTKSFIDLTAHEKRVLYPIVVIIVLMGIYPSPVLSISEAAVNNLLSLFTESIASIK
jgi:NADH-quinone oxidoreductase subunit M